MKEGLSSGIRCEQDGAIALVTIDRPAMQNALDWVTLSELRRIFLQLQHDDGVRVVMLTGAGNEAFSVGIEAEELATMTPEEARAFACLGGEVAELIENLGKPVIAAINGVAANGGCELALACTLRIAAAGASFAHTEVALTLTPAFGFSRRLPRLLGRSRALELILTGVPFSAEDALRMGIINRIVAIDELLQKSRELAHKISSGAPLAIRYAIEAINYGAEALPTEGFRFESALFSLCFATEDAHEGTRAFLEKRLPRFIGK